MSTNSRDVKRGVRVPDRGRRAGRGQRAPRTDGLSVVRCRHCHRPVRLLDPRHPLRLLVPRCGACLTVTLGPAHKAVAYLLAFALIFLVIHLVFYSRTGLPFW